MKFNVVQIFSFITLFNFISFPAVAETIFNDSFEAGNMSTTSKDGFKWDKNNKTSIVTQDPTDGAVAIFNNKAIYNIQTSKSWKAKTKSNSLRFSYAKGVHWSEQRYDLKKGYPDIWVSYWIRVPVNYKRDAGRNNKWFNIQMAPMSKYQDPTVSRIEMQDWPDTNNSMKINIQFRNGTDGKFKNSNIYNNFVTPNDAGKWMHIVYHLKASSSNSATDGLIRMYRKWQGDPTYTLINDLSNINVGIGAGSIASGTLGWSAGYLMGYANTTYATHTEWLLDDLTISDTPLLKAPSKIESLANNR